MKTCQIYADGAYGRAGWRTRGPADGRRMEDGRTVDGRPHGTVKGRAHGRREDGRWTDARTKKSSNV